MALSIGLLGAVLIIKFGPDTGMLAQSQYCSYTATVREKTTADRAVDLT